MKRLGRLSLILLLGGFAVVLLRALWALPAVPLHLGDAVAGKMDQSGVSHPLTAVLLNFRGYDTLLEIGVLLMAGLAALAVSGKADATPRAELLDRPAVLLGLMRVLVPVTWRARLALCLGFLVFLLVSALVMGHGRELLAYPVAQAGLWILLIEAAATLSIGAIFTLLFLGVVAREDEP